MQIATLEEIRTKAIAAHEASKPWHFHVMSPDCLLNTNDQYAFVFEGERSDDVLVSFSDRPEKELALELSPLLHGKDVLDPTSTDDNYQPSEIISQMTDRVAELNSQRIEWHHHMLFPNCIFNGYSPSHVLMVEDTTVGEEILSITEHDPVDDLRKIEHLFFENRT